MMGLSEAPDICPPSEDHLTRRHWMLLLVLACVQFCHIFDFIILVPLGPALEKSLQINTRQFGLLVSAYGFAACITALLVSRWVDRFDRKRTLLLLFGGFIVGTFLCAVAPDYEVLMAGRLIAGGFGGVIGAAVLTIVGDAFPAARRATATGAVMSAFSVASIAGVPSGLFLAEWSAIGWRAPFAVLTALSVLLFVLAVFAIPPICGHLSGANFSLPFRAVLSHPAHLRAYALMFALVCSTFAMMPYLPKFLVDNVGFRMGHLQLMYFVGGIAALVSMNVVGRLADRYPRLLVFRLCASAALIPLLLLSLLPHGTPPAVVLLITTLVFILTSGRMVPAMAMITSAAAPAYRGGFLSVNAAVQLFGTGVAPILASLLMPDARPGEPLAGYPWVASVCVAMGLLAVYLGGLIRPASPSEAPAEMAEPEQRVVLPNHAPAASVNRGRITGCLPKGQGANVCPRSEPE
jgi:predicted MFS family arabinose efflux permease